MASASLALMAKIKKLLESSRSGENTFLALSPIARPLSASELELLPRVREGPRNNEEFVIASEFAETANLIPDVASVWSSDGRTVWDVYETVLTQARVAAGERTAEEKEALEQARGLLYSEDLEETEAYRTYLRLQIAHLEAEENLNNAVIALANSDDPGVRSRLEADLPRLRAKTEHTLTAWRIKGRKEDVENAISEIARLSARGPRRLFDEALAAFEGARRHTAGIALRYYETAYLPVQLFTSEAGGWSRITLDRSEIRSLSEASRSDDPDLQAFAAEDDDLEIRRITAEVAVAEIVRPWFRFDLLTGPFWDLPAGLSALSDGSSSPTGALTAFPTALVFVRNFVAELDPKARSNRAAVMAIQAGKPRLLGNILIEQVPSTTAPGKVATLKAAKLNERQTLQLRGMLRTRSAGADGTSRPGAGTPAATSFRLADASAAGPHIAGAVKASALATTLTAAARPTVRGPLASIHARLLDAVDVNFPVVVAPTKSGFRGRLLEAISGGKPIGGGRVTFVQDGGRARQSVTTDDAGNYRVRVPAGRYLVTSSAEGYQDFSSEPARFVVPAGAFGTGDIRLTPEPEAGRETEENPGVQLIAFLCRRLPRAPDPDPELFGT